MQISLDFIKKKKPIIGGLFFLISELAGKNGGAWSRAMTDTQLEKFEKIIGYEFKNRDCLKERSHTAHTVTRLKDLRIRAMSALSS